MTDTRTRVTLAPMDEQGIQLFEKALLSPEGTGEFQWNGRRRGGPRSPGARVNGTSW